MLQPKRPTTRWRLVAWLALSACCGCATTTLNISDLDKDGISDVGDQCPGVREDGRHPDPHDGCPGTTTASADDSEATPSNQTAPSTSAPTAGTASTSAASAGGPR